jgi:hypothetical protein
MSWHASNLTLLHNTDPKVVIANLKKEVQRLKDELALAVGDVRL